MWFLFSNSVVILQTFGWESEYRFFPIPTRPQRPCAWLPPLLPVVTFPFSLFPLSFWYSCRQRGGVRCGKQAARFVNDHTCSFFPWLESRKLVIQYVRHLFDNSFHTQWFIRASMHSSYSSTVKYLRRLYRRPLEAYFPVLLEHWNIYFESC